MTTPAAPVVDEMASLMDAALETMQKGATSTRQMGALTDPDASVEDVAKVLAHLPRPPPDTLDWDGLEPWMSLLAREADVPKAFERARVASTILINICGPGHEPSCAPSWGPRVRFVEATTPGKAASRIQEWVQHRTDDGRCVHAAWWVQPTCEWTCVATDPEHESFAHSQSWRYVRDGRDETSEDEGGMWTDRLETAKGALRLHWEQSSAMDVAHVVDRLEASELNAWFGATSCIVWDRASEAAADQTAREGTRFSSSSMPLSLVEESHMMEASAWHTRDAWARAQHVWRVDAESGQVSAQSVWQEDKEGSEKSAVDQKREGVEALMDLEGLPMQSLHPLESWTSYDARIQEDLKWDARAVLLGVTMKDVVGYDATMRSREVGRETGATVGIVKYLPWVFANEEDALEAAEWLMRHVWDVPIHFFRAGMWSPIRTVDRDATALHHDEMNRKDWKALIKPQRKNREPVPLVDVDKKGGDRGAGGGEGEGEEDSSTPSSPPTPPPTSIIAEAWSEDAKEGTGTRRLHASRATGIRALSSDVSALAAVADVETPFTAKFQSFMKRSKTLRNQRRMMKVAQQWVERIKAGPEAVHAYTTAQAVRNPGKRVDPRTFTPASVE